MNRDRYEGKPRGHSFGATYSGITATNKPIYDAFPTEWTDEFLAERQVMAKLGHTNRRRAHACVLSLRRHGLIEARAAETGPHGNWLRTELRRKDV